MEVMHALIKYRDVVSVHNNNDTIIHAFAYFRDPAFIIQVDDSMKWVFEFEYKLPDEQIPEKLKFQYFLTSCATEYKKDLEEINDLIRSSAHIVKFRNYNTKGLPITKITGQNSNGKMFGTGTVQGLNEAGENDWAGDIVKDIWESLDKEFPEFNNSLSPLELEDLQHILFMKNRVEGFIGREDIIDKMNNYCESNNEGSPLLIFAEPGRHFK